MVNMMVRFKYSLALAVEEIIKEKIFTEVFFLFLFLFWESLSLSENNLLKILMFF